MLGKSLNHFKYIFAHKFFVVPSDRNYFFARFAKISNINEEFWWQALQTIEKLFKAGLILNGVSVKQGFNHDIEKLWSEHKRIFGDLAVTNLARPEKLTESLWTDDPLEQFIAKMNHMGHADSRYGLRSNASIEDDLFKFDQLAFELRRRTIGLDWIVGDDFEIGGFAEFYGQPYRNVIAQRPEHQIRTMKSPKGPIGEIGEDLEDVIHSWNFSYLRNDADLKRPVPPSFASAMFRISNSYLYCLLYSIKDAEITKVESERVEWLLKSINIGGDAEKEFKRILAAKHKN